ncbi:DUF481 domain-containing protein [Pectobacterium brasiliense]|uniref:DUF481 domain-containing protein n=1 Tax=Pectobacterium brasiliense TaxID=180957 RepID=UPI0019695A77|nr:DUF481 domain-containing protein [Pectobacterium brasiliense]MBN3068071.1 DUF481 domain-containing protein [Pectobacterium brasiliense]MBN3245295.1 DUF481 domain-containing protein [Pectobacterium brasiliense]
MTLSKHALSSLSLVIALSAGITQSRADTIWLTNGDQLTGKITLLDGGKLFINTDYAGSISVAWDKVKTFESDHGLVIQGERYEKGVLYPAVKAGENRAVVASPSLANEAAGPQTLPLSEITSIVAQKPLVTDFAWKGNIDAGMSHKKSSTETDNYDVTLNTKARHDTWRHNLDASYHLAKEDKVESTKNAAGEYALDKFVDENWFWQGRYQYKRDWIESIKINRSFGLGPGYQFWDNDLGAFSLTSLVNSQTFVYRDQGEDNFYSGGIKWAYNRYLFSKSVEAFTNGELGRSFDGTAPIYLKADAGLRFKLTDWSSMSMKVSRTRIESNQGNVDDTLYTMGVGVGW